MSIDQHSSLALRSFARSRRRWPDAVYALAVIIQVGLIWSSRFLPFQDLPEWTFQGTSLAQLWSGALPASYPFEGTPLFQGTGILAPLFSAVLSELFAPPAVSRILATSTLCVFQAGWYVLFQRSTAGHPLRWAGVLFGFNWFFFMGFVNYLVGLGILFAGIGWVQERKNFGDWTSSILIGLLTLLSLAAHPVAAFLLCLFLVVRRIREPHAWAPGGTIRIIAALIPSALVFLLTLAAERPGEVRFYPDVIAGLKAWRPVFLPFHRFVFFDQELPLSILNAVWLVVFLIIIAAVLRALRTPLRRSSAAVTGLIAAAIALIPIASIGEFYLVHLRFLIPAFAFVAASAQFGKRQSALYRMVAVLALSTAAIHAVQIRSLEKSAMEIVDQVSGAIRQEGETLCIARGFAEEFDKRESQIFSGVVRPMLHVRRFADYQSASPSPAAFSTGLLRLRADSGILARARLEDLLEHADRVEDACRILTGHLECIRGHYRRAVLVGEPHTLDALQRSLATVLPVSRRNGKTAVLCR